MTLGRCPLGTFCSRGTPPNSESIVAKRITHVRGFLTRVRGRVGGPPEPAAARPRGCPDGRRAPYTLHPTPFTLHPTLHTPHPTPYTLHPTPYTLHPTPHTLHPTPYTCQLRLSLDLARANACCQPCLRERERERERERDRGSTRQPAAPIRALPKPDFISKHL